ncbi:unnamed protein product [Calypogeia fissa]
MAAFRRVAKKVTGVSFTQDSKWLLFADKFGVAFVIPTSTSEKLDEPVQLLAHCCSIITDLDKRKQTKSWSNLLRVDRTAEWNRLGGFG